MSKLLHETSQTIIVDSSTGEVINSTVMDYSTHTIRNDEPPFVKLYLNDILYHSTSDKISKVNLSETLILILKKAHYADDEDGKGMFIYTGEELINYIKKHTGLSRTSIIGKIKELKDAQILLSYNKNKRGKYLLNPHYFGKGDWKDVKQIHSHVIYDNKNNNFNYNADENIKKNNINKQVKTMTNSFTYNVYDNDDNIIDNLYTTEENKNIYSYIDVSVFENKSIDDINNAIVSLLDRQRSLLLNNENNNDILNLNNDIARLISIRDAKLSTSKAE